MSQKIQFYKENTVNINLSFTGVDLTGSTVYFTIKSAYDSDQADASAIIKKDITSHTNPTQGLTTITLLPADTSVAAGKYGYDIKLKKATGEQSTITVGEVTVKDVYTLRA